jgi:dUTP pyrophosphatase
MTEKILPPFKVEIKRRVPEALLPKKAHPTDVGFDLHACLPQAKRIRLQPGKRVLVDTGIALGMPPHLWALIKDRSGWAAKHGIHVLAGVIDPGYRGPVKVVLANLGEEEVVIEHGMRIAQLIFLPVLPVGLVEVQEFSDKTDRGEKGFGSSGVV